MCMCFDGQVICANGVVIALKGVGGVYKGWDSQLALLGAIILTVQRAPGNFEYIYIIMNPNNLFDVISIQIAF